MKLCDHYKNEYSCLTCPYSTDDLPCEKSRAEYLREYRAANRDRINQKAREGARRRRQEKLKAEFPHLFGGEQKPLTHGG